MALRDRFTLDEFMDVARAAEARTSGLTDATRRRPVVVVPGDSPLATNDGRTTYISEGAVALLRTAYENPDALNAADGWERARAAVLSIRREIRDEAAPRTDTSTVPGARLLAEGVRDYGATVSAGSFVYGLELPERSEQRLVAAFSDDLDGSVPNRAVRELLDVTHTGVVHDPMVTVNRLHQVETGQRAAVIADLMIQGGRVEGYGRLDDALGGVDADVVRAGIATDITRRFDRLAAVGPVDPQFEARAAAETGESVRRRVLQTSDVLQQIAESDRRLLGAAQQMSAAEHDLARAIEHGHGIPSVEAVDRWHREAAGFGNVLANEAMVRAQLTDSVLGELADTAATARDQYGRGEEAAWAAQWPDWIGRGDTSAYNLGVAMESERFGALATRRESSLRAWQELGESAYALSTSPPPAPESLSAEDIRGLAERRDAAIGEWSAATRDTVSLDLPPEGLTDTRVPIRARAVAEGPTPMRQALSGVADPIGARPAAPQPPASGDRHRTPPPKNRGRERG